MDRLSTGDIIFTLGDPENQEGYSAILQRSKILKNLWRVRYTKSIKIQPDSEPWAMAVGWRRRFMVQAPVSQPVNSLDSTLMHCPLIKLRSPLRSALVTIIPKTCDKYRLEKKKASVYT